MDRQDLQLRPPCCPSAPWLSSVALAGAFLAWWRGRTTASRFLGAGLLGLSWCLAPDQNLLNPRGYSAADHQPTE